MAQGSGLGNRGAAGKALRVGKGGREVRRRKKISREKRRGKWFCRGGKGG
jgi:hypothetical protein